MVLGVWRVSRVYIGFKGLKGFIGVDLTGQSGFWDS